MYNIERKRQILEILNKEKSISVKRLSEMLYVSMPTVRRDLQELQNEKKLYRTHGGAVVKNTVDNEMPLMLREDENENAKKIISEKAERFITDGMTVFLDASSTASHLVPVIARHKDIIVITSSPKTSIKLAEYGTENYCTGGKMLLHSVAYVGSSAENFIKNFNADIFFFSSRGYSENGNITDSSLSEAEIKKAMMKNAKKVYYLADKSKKGKEFAFNICNISEIDGIVTE